MVILPAAYMPSVEYVARLLREECVIDLGENYVKRSERNRASILSAYKSSPYFDHYAHLLEPFYKREWRFLVDYNIEYTQTLLRLLGARVELPLSESYVTAGEGDIDLRPKQKGSTFVAEPYFQVFSDRMPFAENLSVLDLLLCEGPSAIDAVLKRCQL